MSGMVNPDYSPSRHLATLKDNLKWAESLLTSDDVILTIEPISAKPGYFMDDYDKGAQRYDAFSLNDYNVAIRSFNM